MPFHEALAAHEEVVLLRELSGSDRSSAMVADIVGRVMPGASQEMVVARIEAEAAALVREAAPFLDTLDPDARRTILRASELGQAGKGDRDAVYAALDASFDPDAPLARAWAWNPRLRYACTAIMRDEPATFRKVVAAGRDTFRAALRERFILQDRRTPAQADRILAAQDLLRDVDHETDLMLRAATEASRSDPLVPLCDALALLPASWWPRDAEAFLSYACCHEAVTWCTARAAPSGLAAMVNASDGWSVTSRRLRAAHGGDGSSETLSAAVADVWDVWDVQNAFSRQVPRAARPDRDAPRDHAHDHAVGRAAEAMLWSGRSVRKVLEVSRAWHAAREGIEAALPQPAHVASWPAVLPDVRYGQVAVTVLVDREALRREGSSGTDDEGHAGLSHCVGGYAPRCLSGRSRILSVRAADGTRLATAEASLVGGHVNFLQARGASNSDPPDEAVGALVRYRDDLADGRLSATAPSLPVLGTTSAADVFGYDADAPGAWETAYRLWAPFLPRRLRSLTRAEVSLLADRTGRLPDWRWWTEVGVSPP